MTAGTTERGPRTALVTGGNRGIGLAIVEGLLGRGWRVLLGSRDRSRGAEAARTLGGGVIPVRLELGDPARRRSDIDALVERDPGVEVLVHNAGILEEAALCGESAPQLEASMQVHVHAALDLVRALVPGMARRGHGRIVVLSSGWGTFSEGLEGPPAYAISKAALNALVVKFAQELPESIKVNAADPGWVRTDMGGPDAPRSPAQGADTPLWLASLPDDGPTGGLFRDRRRVDW